MLDLKVLQAVRLKGRVSPSDVAGTIVEDPTDVADAMTNAVENGLLIEGKTVRLSEEGRSRLNQLLDDERRGVDQDVVAAAYGDFRDVNLAFKELVSDWQLKDGQPNAHTDLDYDGAVLARLADVHARVVPIMAVITTQLPRLQAYSDKLGVALERVQAGDTSWLTRPIVDSYHTVWFELHEELILAAGLTREGEARAGHAH